MLKELDPGDFTRGPTRHKKNRRLQHENMYDYVKSKFGGRGVPSKVAGAFVVCLHASKYRATVRVGKFVSN